MRLAVFTNQFPGRVSTFFARDIRGLIEAGIDVDVFPIYPLDPALWCYVPDILNEKILPRNKVHHITLPQCLQAAKFWPLRKLSLFLRDTLSISTSAIKFGPESLVKTNYVFLKSWVWAQRYGNQFDHVLGYWGNYTGTCAYLFRRLADTSMPFSIFLHAGIDLYENRLYLRQKLINANNIITCSDFNPLFIKDHFLDIWDILSGKVHVHHHGLDFTAFPFKPDDRPSRKILGVGSLEKYKGFDYLVHAIRELTVRGIDCELELVGDGKERDSLRRLVKKLRISDRVNFRGWLGPEVIPKAMMQTTVLVHPSPELGDGVPNVIKEAMALGTPVVASTVAGIPELLDKGENGILVPPKDVKALADGIETLLRNDSLRRSYAIAARRHAEEKFDLWRNGQRLASILCSTSRQERIRSQDFGA